MATQQVHDKTGRKCHCCGKEFTKQSFTIPVSQRDGQMIIKLLVCGDCHHKYHEARE